MHAEAQVKTANKSKDKKAENQKVPSVSSKTLVVKHLQAENCKETSSWSSRWTSLWSFWRQSSQQSSSSLFSVEEQNKKPLQFKLESSPVNNTENIEKISEVSVKVNIEKNSVVQKQTTKNMENPVKSQQILGPVNVKTPCLMNIISQRREADIARYLTLNMRSQQVKPARLPLLLKAHTFTTKPSVKLSRGDVWGFSSDIE